MRPAVFLDRDGTIIHEQGYLLDLANLSLFPWTAAAIRLLNQAGFALVVVTNQGAIAQGIIDESFVSAVHREIDRRIHPARIDAYYFCPHHPKAVTDALRTPCDCRKPRPGLLEQACRDLDLDPARSFMVGDRWRDVECGRTIGTRTVLVRTGHGADEERRPPAGVRADAILNSLMEAAEWILRSSSR